MTNNQESKSYVTPLSEADKRLVRGLTSLMKTIRDHQSCAAFLEERAASKFQVDRENLALDRSQEEARRGYSPFIYRG